MNTSLFYLPLGSQAFLPKQTGNFSPDLFLTMPSHFGTTGGQKTKLELQGLAEGTVVVSLTLLCGPAHTAMLAGQLAAHSQRVSQKWRPQCSPQQPPQLCLHRGGRIFSVLWSRGMRGLVRVGDTWKCAATILGAAAISTGQHVGCCRCSCLQVLLQHCCRGC